MSRTFTSPSGRVWSAALLELPANLVEPGGRRMVLRFESGAVALDLLEWPEDWASLSDAALVELARRASTPNYSPRELQ